MRNLRVLFLWNTAGALTPVADWLIDNGQYARIIMARKFDPFGNTSLSSAALMVDSNAGFYKSCVRHLLTFQPTHIHVNQSLPALVLARLFRPRTPIVFEYHGFEVRYRDHVHPETALADKVIVSTPDLERYGEWFDRPVDKMFRDRGGRRKNTAVMFYVGFNMKDLREEARQWCTERGIELQIVDREKGHGIPYLKMPYFLSKFEYLLDFKGYGDTRAISRLAVEALACGCKVVSDTDPSRIIQDYDFARPEKYIELYKSLKPPPFMLRRLLVIAVAFVKWASGRIEVPLSETPR